MSSKQDSESAPTPSPTVQRYDYYPDYPGRIVGCKEGSYVLHSHDERVKKQRDDLLAAARRAGELFNGKMFTSNEHQVIFEFETAIKNCIDLL